MTGPHDPIIPGAPSWNGTGYSKLLANSVIRWFNRNNLIHLGVSRSHSVMPGGQPGHCAQERSRV